MYVVSHFVHVLDELELISCTSFDGKESLWDELCRIRSYGRVDYRVGLDVTSSPRLCNHVDENYKFCCPAGADFVNYASTIAAVAQSLAHIIDEYIWTANQNETRQSAVYLLIAVLAITARSIHGPEPRQSKAIF
jgi:hypothetical protein